MQIDHYFLDINMHHLYVYKYNIDKYAYNYMNISQWKDKELNEWKNSKLGWDSNG